ncbi:MAG: hypothetical protein OEX07_05155, partial [Gammaproteobacteria bacterium]|nr:hypothetical protein [Gammaproteobacteria bacterium]
KQQYEQENDGAEKPGSVESFTKIRAENSYAEHLNNTENTLFEEYDQDMSEQAKSLADLMTAAKAIDEQAFYKAAYGGPADNVFAQRLWEIVKNEKPGESTGTGTTETADGIQQDQQRSEQASREVPERPRSEETTTEQSKPELELTPPSAPVEKTQAAPTEKQDELFDKDDNAQTTHDQKLAKDKSLNGSEDVSVDNGKADDLFSQAIKQTDIGDTEKQVSDLDSWRSKMVDTAKKLKAAGKDQQSKRAYIHAGYSNDGATFIGKALKGKGEREIVLQQATDLLGSEIKNQNDEDKIVQPETKADNSADTLPSKPSKATFESFEGTVNSDPEKIYIEDFSDKAIIIKGNTMAHKDTIKTAISQKPLWNKRAQGWIFPKRREAEVREALSDILNQDSQKSEPAKSTNKIFTEDAAEKARALLRSKLGSLNSGMDPEVLQAGITLAGYHIESGARKFSDYSKAMISDLGDVIKPYLRAFYESARHYPGFDNEGMTSAIDIDNNREAKDAKPAIVKTEDNANGDLFNDNQGTDQRPESGRIQKTGTERGTGSDNARLSGASDLGQKRSSPASKKDSRSKRPAIVSRGNEHGGNERAGDRNVSDNGRTNLPVRTNYRITDADNLGVGSALQKAKANIEAIRIIKTLRSENRHATKSEQVALVKYTGWGASELANKLFPSKAEPTGSWKELHDELRELLTEDELKSAARSTQYAHYTSKPIIDAIYKAISNFGLTNGLAIEGGAGTGNFIGLMPSSFDIHYAGVEMDGISATVAKALYPESGVIEGDFTRIGLPQNHFDLSIGNPPFASITVKSDSKYKNNNFKLHDYFIAKQIDSVKPGGIAVFVTSKGTMDKQDSAAREYLSARANLLGALRLPQTAFKENAGTEVVTDILFFQKLNEGEEAAGNKWKETREIKLEGGTASINEYFISHPGMILGKSALTSSQFRSDEYTVLPTGDLNSQLDQAIDALPSDVYHSNLSNSDFESKRAEYSIDPKNKEASYYLDENKGLRIVEDGVGVKLKVRGGDQRTGMSKKQAETIRDYIPLRDAVMKVYHEQFIDGDWKAAQKELHRAYDSFSRKHGPINQVKTITRKDGVEIVTEPIINTIDMDPEAYRVASIEHYDETTNTAKKGSIFTENVIAARKEADIESATDALNVTLNDRGYVDLEYMAEKYGVSVEETLDELDTAIFKDPETGRYVTEDDYLSGNVKAKLAEAKEANKNGGEFSKNITALKEVQPEDLPLSRIPVNLGAMWINKEVINKFAEEVMSFKGSVTSFIKGDNSNWNVAGESNSEKYATRRMTAVKILDAALNKRTIKVYDEFLSDGKTIREINRAETAAANQKIQDLKEEFERWSLSDTESAEILHEKYNKVFNTVVPRKFNGKHLTLPRLSSRYRPHPWQMNVVWRILQRGNTYMAHTVGSGKTLASNIAGMELRRLGMAKKPTYVVLKSTLKQFATELLDAYPDAKILVADEKQLDKKNRRRFLARMASEDFDAVILTHQAFEKIPLSEELITKQINSDLAEYRELLEEVDEDDRASRKTIERQIEAMEGRLTSMTSQEKKDAGLSFEELGIDFIFVDEAHTHKKIPFPTSQSNLKGVDSTGSGI